VILAVVLLVTLLLTAFGSAGPDAVRASRPALAERLLPSGPPRPQVIALQGTLRLRNYLGWVMACEIELPGGMLIRAQAVNPRTQLRFAEGGPVAVRFSPEDVLLLKQSS
jgi:hypothetical protein